MLKSFQIILELLTSYFILKVKLENVCTTLINTFIFILNLKDCWITDLK